MGKRKAVFTSEHRCFPALLRPHHVISHPVVPRTTLISVLLSSLAVRTSPHLRFFSGYQRNLKANTDNCLDGLVLKGKGGGDFPSSFFTSLTSPSFVTHLNKNENVSTFSFFLEGGLLFTQFFVCLRM